MEKKINMIASAEEAFAREVALGVQVTSPLTVWHSIIPGMFIIDFLKRGSAVRRYSSHYMLPRKIALDAAHAIAHGQEKGARHLQAEEEINTRLSSRNLYSDNLRDTQMAVVRLLLDHYTHLLGVAGDSYYDLIENAYNNREKYEAFLSHLAAAEEEVDLAVLEAEGEDEKLRDRLEREKIQVGKQREKHSERIFSWIG